MICRTAAMAAVAGFADGWRPPSTDYIDHDTLPVRCHWDDPADAGRCDVVLQSVADAWAAQVDGLGFASPLPDDDGVLDFYISDEGTEGGAYTYGPYTDEVSGDGRMGCHSYVALDPAIPLAELDVYVAHEFNHVLQYAMDFAEPTLPIWEAVASASETWTYPDDPLDARYVRDFQSTPWLGLLGDSYILWDDYGTWSEYEYGAAIWINHLDDGWGDGEGAAGADLWWATVQEGWNNEPDVLDAYETLTGDWRAALMELSVARARIGTELAPAWAAEFTESRFEVALADSLDAGDLPAELAPSPAPFPTGVIYVSVSGLPAGEVIEVSAASEDEVQWGLLVVDGADGTWTTEPGLTWTTASDELLVGLVHLGGGEFDADQRVGETPVSLSIGLYAPGDTADPGDPPGAGGGGGGKSEPAGGCSATGLPTGSAGLLALGLLALRRRRRVG